MCLDTYSGTKLVGRDDDDDENMTKMVCSSLKKRKTRLALEPSLFLCWLPPSALRDRGSSPTCSHESEFPLIWL